ncbi:MAG: outer membrane lipoprotein carrier protein LolA [Holophaga sp.]|nr:outer membrane lipoprotein carrier protein LolA [Holophaga sp.]
MRFTAWVLLLAMPLLGAQNATPTVKELVERFDAAQAKVTSLQVPFSLTIRRALLRTPTVTKGTLYIQGSDLVHFSFAPPEDLILHLTAKELISYSPTAGEGERLKIGLIRNHDRRFLGLGQKLAELSDYFQISAGESKELPACFQLTLIPQSYNYKKRLKALYIWVDREKFLLRQLTWIEKSGDSWQLELGAMQINHPIPTAVTTFKVPPGVPLRSEFSFFATRKSK